MNSKKILFNVTKNISCLTYMRQHQQSLYSHYVDKNYVLPSILANALRYSSDSPLKCWNCNFMYKSDLFCSKCKVLQEPPENITYFDIIGIPKSYDVTVADIQKKYIELQKLLHPDKFSTKSEKEKEISEMLSSLVNKAYSTLSHPDSIFLKYLSLKTVKK
ncbi:iron-sulfur cluster co-chaperone protein HscB, mitochondrial-like [Ceratina calcarata]|uniref:Iron-sulfur cluster co-chaperone protein HscB, mitochondrial-like n=1 Tax=Ceratina calcarata TaxID=156304 RepID=A0AAJ7NCS1_9HYME|nr:iron-sulfur cluster co-chaperone protein HscB, mitochondrial-like [Ceratina calcarata]